MKAILDWLYIGWQIIQILLLVLIQPLCLASFCVGFVVTYMRVAYLSGVKAALK